MNYELQAKVASEKILEITQKSSDLASTLSEKGMLKELELSNEISKLYTEYIGILVSFYSDIEKNTERIVVAIKEMSSSIKSDSTVDDIIELLVNCIDKIENQTLTSQG